MESGGASRTPPKGSSQAPPDSSGSVTATSSGSSDSVKWADFLNPFMYELQSRHLRRATAAESWGIEVSTVSTDVVQVTTLTSGGLAETAKLEKGAYVMAMNGRKVTNTATAQAQLECNRSSLRIVLAVKRKPPWDPKAPIAIPRCWERRSEHDYLLVRLDPTDGKRVGTGVGVDKCGRVFISIVLKDSAGSAAGLRIGDRVVCVNNATVLGRHQCRTMVKDMQGNPFDMIIERAKDSANQPQSPCARNLVSDKEGGEPAMGVPECPDDVAVLLESKTKEVLRSILSARSEAKSAQRPSQKKSLRVKLRKDVNKEKLKRDKP